jgi:integrase
MRPLPRDAEIVERNGERIARWRTVRGKTVTAAVRETAKGLRAVSEGSYWMARFRDGTGVTRTVSTKCSDRAAAMSVLGELVRRSELVKSGVLTPAEDAAADHKRADIQTHVDAFIRSLQARICSARHIASVKRRLTAVLEGCRCRRLQDLKRDSVERWLTSDENCTRSARTRNTYLIALKSFANWAVQTERLVSNPVARIAHADEKADQRRQPRALSETEIVALLDAARRRPLVEARRFNRGWRRGKNGAHLRPETVAKLERLGWERALAYRVMVLTGLRLGELGAVRVCDLELDAPRPLLHLAARHTKNREGATIVLRADLAAELRQWIAVGEGPADRPLLRAEQSLLKVFNRDLAFAGIAKRDERGRTVCIHSLRHSFATMMSRHGVAPRVAQAAMRHSTIDLTMGVYTDPRLLDVGAAIDALPALLPEATAS